MLGFKTTLLLLGAFVLSVHGQDALCFDREKAEPVYKSLNEKCKTEVPEDAENRKGQIGLCLLKEMGVLIGNSVLDFPKFKADTLSVLVAKKEEIEALLDKCWTDAPEGDSKLVKFFVCYKEKVDEVCPEESKTWMQCDEMQ